MCNTQRGNVSGLIKQNSESLKALIKPSVEALSRSQLPPMALDLLSMDALPRGVQRKRALLSTLCMKRFEYNCSSTDLLLHFVYWLRAEEFCVSSHFSLPSSSVGVNTTLKRFELRLDDFEEFDQISFLPLLRRFAVAFPNLEHLDISVDDCRAYQKTDMVGANAALAKYTHFVKLLEADLEAAQDATTGTFCSCVPYHVSFKSNFECTLETMYDYRNALAVNDTFELVRDYTAAGSLGPVEEDYERRISFGPQVEVVAGIYITYVWPPDEE
ncbi:hypothetical protein AAVH_04994 [Aphelenchoides avenae]|nr:hypothetical protein AAVH_04994 [Aphelenchus avenae]